MVSERSSREAQLSGFVRTGEPLCPSSREVSRDRSGTVLSFSGRFGDPKSVAAPRVILWGDGRRPPTAQGDTLPMADLGLIFIVAPGLAGEARDLLASAKGRRDAQLLEVGIALEVERPFAFHRCCGNGDGKDGKVMGYLASGVARSAFAGIIEKVATHHDQVGVVHTLTEGSVHLLGFCQRCYERGTLSPVVITASTP